MVTLMKSQSNSLWRVYKNKSARKSALTQLNRSGKYNYFVLYQDVRGPAMNVAHVDWVAEGQVYVD
jgi:hypothetical protein